MTVELQPDFFERCASQQRDLFRPEGPYDEVLGDYTMAWLVDGARDDPDARLETLWVRHIQQRLDAQPDRPIISYDVGGGVGVTSLKLAFVFPEAIAEGRLIPVVSELRGGPEDFLAHAVKLLPKYNNQTQVRLAAAMLQRFGRDVCYVQTALTTGSIRFLWRGQVIDLSEGVDFIHERRSATTWSRIPEWHIMQLGGLMVPGSLYLVDRSDTTKICGAVAREGNEREQRLTGVAAAHRALQEVHGFTAVDRVEAGRYAGRLMTYRIFKGRKAAPITVG